MLKICKRCEKGFEVKEYLIRNRHTAMYCSRSCANKANARKGKDCWNWKGDNVGYHGIHDWLELHYGKANKCERENCKQISKRFEWAKLKNVPYERKRDNFIQLCKSCHTLYDIKETTYFNKKHSLGTKDKLSLIVTKWWANKKEKIC